MYPTSRFGSKMTALVATLLLVGTAGAGEANPAAPPAIPLVNKTTIYNGSRPTVSYTVQGGSPHLQALAMATQFTENEVNLTGELQKLRLEIVANEQTLDSVHTSQQMGLGPIPTPGYAACYPPADSALKSALIPGLAREATPATAYELINLWELQQTELQAEQAKAVGVLSGAPPANQNALPLAPVAGPVAMPHLGSPAPAPGAQPLVLGRNPTQPVRTSLQSGAQPFPTVVNQQSVAAFQQMVQQRIRDAQERAGMYVGG